MAVFERQAFYKTYRSLNEYRPHKPNNPICCEHWYNLFYILPQSVLYHLLVSFSLILFVILDAQCGIDDNDQIRSLFCNPKSPLINLFVDCKGDLLFRRYRPPADLSRAINQKPSIFYGAHIRSTQVCSMRPCIVTHSWVILRNIIL